MCISVPCFEQECTHSIDRGLIVTSIVNAEWFPGLSGLHGDPHAGFSFLVVLEVGLLRSEKAVLSLFSVSPLPWASSKV